MTPVNTALPDFIPALPEIFLLVMACVVMMADLFVKSERRTASYVLSHLTLVGCAGLTLMVMAGTTGGPVYTFSGLFVADTMSHLLKLAGYIAASTTLVYSRQYMLDRGLMTGEYLSLLLFSILGGMILMSANSFLTVYMGLELLSLCLYAMVALNRDSAASTEAAMKYFVLGALASGLLLYGMSMIYGATEVAKVIGSGSSDKTILVFGLVFTVCGTAFKLGVAPFHMWIPDVYHGAPTAVTLVIGTAPKLAAFAMAMRLLVNGMLDLAADWQQMLAIMAVISMAIGNVTAIAQTNMKRMLAYSTISHMGFLLLGLVSGVVGGNWFNAADAYSASMFYIVVYVLMTLGAFGMLLFLSRAGFECERLEDFKGLNRRSPWYAFIMLILMFSLAGLPPTGGFFAKYAVISAAVSAGQVWLAVVAVLFSLIGAFFYLRIVKLMYFDEPDEASPRGGVVMGPREMRVLLSVNGLALLVLGVLPQPLVALCMLAIKSL
jgi:NADH-quinone oxidoreductase subunit N